jgi:uncharacterized phiE125 gp8 family phage protein
MALKVITPPSAVLTLEQLRRHCKIDPPASANEADTDLSAALAAAHAFAQHYAGISIGSQTLELALDEFPIGGIQLPQGPVTSITSVTYLDMAGNTQTVSSGAYNLDDYSNPPWLLPAAGSSWPETYEAANAVKVRYVAGAATIDGAVAQALRLLTGLYFDNRNAADKGQMFEVPFGVKALLDTVKDWSR